MLSNMNSKDQITRKLEEVSNILKQIRKEYPNEFEYVFQGAIYTKGEDSQKGDIILVDAINLKNLNSLEHYANQLVRHNKYNRECSRFEQVMRWAKTCRVICINDTVPEGVQSPLNIVKGATYQCSDLLYDDNKLLLNLKIRDLDTGELIPAPKPFKGFSSVRFDIVDYAKLN